MAGKTVGVRCPRCSRMEQVATTAVAARCPGCAARWRWAICSSCDVIGLPYEWDEAWRCKGCGTTVRSWWRTDDAYRYEAEVRRRRAKDADSGLTPWIIGGV